MALTRITRQDVLRQISEIAELCDWRHHRSRVDGLTRAGYADGFPTDVLVRGNRLILVTVGHGLGRLTPAQSSWVRDLESVTAVSVFAVDESNTAQLIDALRAEDRA